MDSSSMIRGGGFTFEKYSTGGRWHWKVYSELDASSCLKYFVTDICSPWGLLTSVMAPIPQDVIAAIQESTQALSNQFLPNVAFADSSQSTLSIAVAEGDSDELVATVTVVNTGAFGSFANFQASTTAPWLRITPAQISGIHKNGIAEFEVYVRPSLMLHASSPYNGVVVFTDGTNSISSSISATVSARPTIQVNPTVLAFAHNITTNTTDALPTLQIENSGLSGSLLSFTIGKVQNTSSWLTLSASSGSDVASGDDVTITFTLIPGAFPPLTGVYTEILRVSSPNATNNPVLVPVTFTITG